MPPGGFTNGVLSGVILLYLHRLGTYSYPGFLIYAMAAYVFSAVILAAVHLIRARRQRSPFLSVVRTISMASALVSLLALEIAMLTEFGGEHEEPFRLRITAATGGGVCLVISAMAVYTILQAHRHLADRTGRT